MSDTTVNLEVAKENAVTESGWIILKVMTVGANIKRKQATNERTVWATLGVPEQYELQVAMAQPGAEQGELPEGVVTLEALEEAAKAVVSRLEVVLIEREDSEKTKGW